MNEYFVVTNSFAAPFFSDTDTQHVEASDPKAALEIVAQQYQHPAGLYAAACYTSADAYHKREAPIAQWLCNHEQEKQRLTAQQSYSYFGHAPGDFEIDGVRHHIENPKEGSVVP